MDIPFGPLTPDLGELGGVQVADNVLPRLNGWGPHPSLFSPTSAGALAGQPRGVFSLVLNAGAWEAYMFTASTLYQLQSDYTFAQIATGYSLPTSDSWSALHFGSKFLFTNVNDGMLQYDVEAGGAVTSIAGAGKPQWIFTCANFIIALNCLDNGGNRDNRLIKTSAFNDQTNWTTEGADYQELADGEALVAGFDLTNNRALLLQQRALVLMTFGNAPGGAQFSLQKVADGKGSVGPNSCVSFNGAVYWLDTDDFYMFTEANGVQAIGANAIAKTFLASVDQANLSLVQGSVDPVAKVIRWIYKRSSDALMTSFSVGIGYDWSQQRWFTFTENLSYLTRLATVAVSYDAATGTYDSQTLTYDDRFFTGGEPVSAGLDANYKFCTFSGPSLPATLASAVSNSPTSGKILRCSPISDAANLTVQVGSKDNLSDIISYGEMSQRVESGIVPLYDRGLNIQMKVTIPSGDVTGSGQPWTYINGIDHVTGTPGSAI